MFLVCNLVNLRPDIGVCSFDIDKVSSSEVVHLLDCLWRCHLSPCQLTDPPPPKTKTKCCASMPCLPGCPGSHRNPSSPDMSGFLESKPGLRSIFCKLSEKLGYLILGCLWEEDESFSFGVTVPTATELHQSGVKFARNNESTHLLDIKFDGQQGIRKIPYFFMGDSTETIFRNLLAFEQYQSENDHQLTDYFQLLDNLINQPSDVDLLVQSKVLDNTLGDSTQAASIINNISQGLMLIPPSSFEVLCKALNDYYKVPWHKWKAILRQRYFNNPWAGISVIAAAVLLGLTIAQTVYAVKK